MPDFLLGHQQKAMFRLVQVPGHQARAPSVNGALVTNREEENVIVSPEFLESNSAVVPILLFHCCGIWKQLRKSYHEKMNYF